MVQPGLIRGQATTPRVHNLFRTKLRRAPQRGRILVGGSSGKKEALWSLDTLTS